MMNRTLTIVGVGAVALAVLGIAATRKWGNNTTAASGARAGTHQRDADQARELSREVRRLQGQLSLVEARLAAQGEKVAELSTVEKSPTPTGAAANPEQALESDPDVVTAERNALWERSFQAERYDATWASGAKERLQTVRTSFPDVAVDGLECRSKTCRFTAKFDAKDPNGQGLGPWVFALNKGFASMHFTRSPDFPGGVYYVTDGDEPSERVQ
jgi:hypothetical protein